MAMTETRLDSAKRDFWEAMDTWVETKFAAKNALPSELDEALDRAHHASRLADLSLDCLILAHIQNLAE